MGHSTVFCTGRGLTGTPDNVKSHMECPELRSSHVSSVWGWGAVIWDGELWLELSWWGHVVPESKARELTGAPLESQPCHERGKGSHAFWEYGQVLSNLEISPQVMQASDLNSRHSQTSPATAQSNWGLAVPLTTMRSLEPYFLMVQKISLKRTEESSEKGSLWILSEWDRELIYWHCLNYYIRKHLLNWFIILYHYLALWKLMKEIRSVTGKNRDHIFSTHWSVVWAHVWPHWIYVKISIF